MSSHYQVTTLSLSGPVFPGLIPLWIGGVLQFAFDWSPNSEMKLLQPLQQIRTLSPSKTVMQGTNLLQEPDPKACSLPVSTDCFGEMVGYVLKGTATDAPAPALKDFDLHRPSTGIHFACRGLGQIYLRMERCFSISVISVSFPGLCCVGSTALKGSPPGLQKFFSKLCSPPLAPT